MSRGKSRLKIARAPEITTILAGLLFLLAPFALRAEEPISLGAIQGRVTNSTFDKQGAAGLEIVLFLQVQDQGRELARTTTTEDGLFSFADQETDEERFYYTYTRYKGVEYFSRIGAFEADESGAKARVLTLDLNVAETTDADDNIRISMHHMLLDLDNGKLSVKELMVVGNLGIRTYVGRSEEVLGQKETLYLSIPKEAVNIQFFQGLTKATLTPSGDGIVDTDPIRPGSTKLQFSYAISTQGNEYKFLKTLTLPTNQFGIIFPDHGFEITSKQLSRQSSVDTEGRKFYTMSGRDFPRGFRVVMNINKIPVKSGVIIWGVTFLAVIIIGAGIGISLKMKKALPEKIYGSREDVLRSIAELDDLAEAGEIDLNDYNMERAVLISKAREFDE